ncbi:YjjW family glycine radical enzyme activase [Texcoconibacillus texcoconensis]|uniref:Pyruvate formate lyase activating enzyme n=1 Tax=Texcoconibacillus texcoconensis TaxID=1095777 RepID=A0A840QMA4_9BACI|nr:YjjW family glycine radical enzyme activase [Texcoconibacillus texcoconensis]MBB5172460.1 pyruvate formate lyase activating enzyme [Texcoconibacillus texcoconensis]
MTTAPINKVMPLSLVDGPGNRSTIFFQGCNLACAYCHNPETQNQCHHCGICVSGCPSGALTKADGRVNWDPEVCVQCDQCIHVCSSNASPKVRHLTPEEIFEEIQKNLPFIRGITVSGGESTLYPHFIKELFTIARAHGLTCLIDSNGTTDLTSYPALLALCEGVMLDVKAWDQQTYQKITGGLTNAVVKKNLHHLACCNKLEEIRIVCLPGEVDAEAVISGIAETIGENVTDVKLKLITFRSNGVNGRLQNTPSPDDTYMQQLLQQAYELGFEKAVIVS